MQSVAGFGGISGRNEKNGGEAEEAGDSSPLSPSQHRRVPITYVGGGSAKLKKGASLDAEAGPTCAHGREAEKPEFRCGSAARSIVLARWRRYAEARCEPRRGGGSNVRAHGSKAKRPEFRCGSAARFIVLARWRRCAEARRVGAEGASQGQLPTGAKRKDQNFDVYIVYRISYIVELSQSYY